MNLVAMKAFSLFHFPSSNKLGFFQTGFNQFSFVFFSRQNRYYLGKEFNAATKWNLILSNPESNSHTFDIYLSSTVLVDNSIYRI